MKVKNLDIEDYGTLDNALNDINEIEGEVSFDIRWHHKISRFTVRNPAADQMFSGEFTQTLATVKWSGRSDDFEFHSDPGSEVVRRAEIGEERNGVFFK